MQLLFDRRQHRSRRHRRLIGCQGGGTDATSCSKRKQLLAFRLEFRQRYQTDEWSEQNHIVTEEVGHSIVIRSHVPRQTGRVAGIQDHGWQQENEIDRRDRQHLHSHLAIVAPFDSSTSTILMIQHSYQKSHTGDHDHKYRQNEIHHAVPHAHPWIGEDARIKITRCCGVIEWAVAR